MPDPFVDTSCPPGKVWNPVKEKCVFSPYDPDYPNEPPIKNPMNVYQPPDEGPAGGDGMPCPSSQCKDVVSGVCRSFNPKREKVNMTDDIERESGGGRGYCRKLDFGGGGGGAFGGGAAGGGGGGPHGGGGGGGTGPAPGAAFNGINPDLLGVGSEISSSMEAFLKGAIGGQTRYTPEVMQDILAGSKAETEGQVAQSTDQLNSDLAQRGLARSTYGAGEAAAVRRAGDQRFSESSRQLRMDKAKTDFEDKLAAVDRAQAYLNSLRSYVAQLDVTQSEREKLKATIELGYARIDAEMKMLLKQLASQKELLGMSLNSQQTIAKWGIESNNWQFLQGLLYQ